MTTTAPARARLTGIGLVVVSSVCFGSGGPAAKAVLAADFEPLQVVQARVAVTAAVLVAVLAATRRSALRVRPGEWPLLIAYGLLAFFAIQTCYVVALSRLPVGVAILLEYLAPVLVALWVRLVRRTVLPSSTWLGAGLAVCGLALVAQVWAGFRLDGLGVAAALAAAVALAGYFLLSERGLAGGDRDAMGLVAWGALVATVPLVLVAPPTSFPFGALATPVSVASWSLPVWLPLLWLGLVATVLAYLTGVAALRYLPSQVVSVLATMETLAAAGIAWALLGETLALVQLAGGAVLLAGVVIVQLTPAAPDTPPVGP